jgi:dihydroxyacetone kinase-like predicted kinase
MSKLGATYGYCTEFLVEQCKAETEQVQEKMLALGDSVIVVGDRGLVKVHLHTKSPEKAEAWLASVATIAKKKIDDIDAQHVEYAAKKVAAPQGAVGVVAVVAGEGLANIFRSLGVTAIVPGGQTMNPSTQDILLAVRKARQDSVIVLPNNSNIIPTAKQVAELAAGKKITVVPTVDVQQGIAAMMAYNYELGDAENAGAMRKAIAAVKTGEVTMAVRNATVDGLSIKRGQAIGISGGKVVAASGEAGEAAIALVRKMGAEAGSAVTVYYGAGVSKGDAQDVTARLRKELREAKVEAFAGGQPHYQYLIAIE